MQRQWIFPNLENTTAVRALAGELNVPEFVARVLLRNGFHEVERAEQFLQPRLKQLADPFLLPDMPAAANRVLAAIERKERIVLYGDYDVDGVASLALLKRVLQALGGTVECFLPHRVEEGYGLSSAGVERCFEEHSPQLFIAVDCGTNSVREAAQIQALGADVIILDHHEPMGDRPACAALVNPKFGRGFEYLCSGGIAFKLAHALLKQTGVTTIDLKDYLDLVALATVADVAPLVEENRVLVQRGMRQMAETRWAGLRELMKVADVKMPVESSDIGFRLGPRINASGRLGTAKESLRLLLTDDAGEAKQLAESLDQQNRQRQTVERSITTEVEAWVEENFDAERDACIVAGEKDWHHGVLGIVAARIMRRHHRPTLLVGFDDEGRGKGSGRSIEGFSLVNALERCAGHLEKFGGHEMAAGVTVQKERFAEFRRAFHESATALASADILTPKLRLDAELSLGQIDRALLESQRSLEPYGPANLQPVFAARRLQPAAPPRVLKEKHLKFDFQAGGKRQGAIYFSGAESPLPAPPWDVAFTLERNEFNGRVDVQMRVIALRTAA